MDCSGLSSDRRNFTFLLGSFLLLRKIIEQRAPQLTICIIFVSDKRKCVCKLWKLIERKMHDFFSGLFMFLSHIELIKEKICNLVILYFCVALELHSRSLQTWIFFWTFLKGIVHLLWKWGVWNVTILQ